MWPHCAVPPPEKPSQLRGPVTDVMAATAVARPMTFALYNKPLREQNLWARLQSTHCSAAIPFFYGHPLLQPEQNQGTELLYRANECLRPFLSGCVICTQLNQVCPLTVLVYTKRSPLCLSPYPPTFVFIL